MMCLIVKIFQISSLSISFCKCEDLYHYNIIDYSFSQLQRKFIT